MDSNYMGNGSSWDFDGINYGSEAAQKFWDEHGRLLTEVAYLVEHYAAAGNGDSLILLDAALLGVCAKIRGHLARTGVQVQALPPSIGAELSKMIQ